jgi:hypothetical protein
MLNLKLKQLLEELEKAGEKASKNRDSIWKEKVHPDDIADQFGRANYQDGWAEACAFFSERVKEALKETSLEGPIGSYSYDPIMTDRKDRDL